LEVGKGAEERNKDFYRYWGAGLRGHMVSASL